MAQNTANMIKSLQDLEMLDIEALQNWLESRGVDQETRQILRDQKVNGELLASCSTPYDLRSMAEEIKGGPVRKIMLELKKLNSPAASSLMVPIKARLFDRQVRGTRYHQNGVLVDDFGTLLVESGPDTSNLTARIVEFKSFKENSVANALNKFCAYSLEFIFGTINSRANGTIYFGIEDRTAKVLGCKLGIPQDDLEFKLLQAIENSVKTPEHAVDVQKCLPRMKFVPVESADSEHRFVIEIDVISMYEFVKERYFLIDIHKFDPSQRGDRLFERVGASTRAKVDKASTMTLVDKALKQNTVEFDKCKKRLAALAELRRKAEASFEGHSGKGEALREMLQSGRNIPFDECRFLVLILDKVKSGPDSTLNFASEMKFVARDCKWNVVVDMNSDKSIYEQYVHNKKPLLIESFRDESHKLKSDSDNTWWIFGNGLDEDELEPKKIADWEAGGRGEGIVELKNQLQDNFDNCLAIFLFTSDSGGHLASIYQRLCHPEVCKTIFIAQYDRALEYLREKVDEDRIKLRVNGMSGLTWPQVDNVLRGASGQPSPECEIALSLFNTFISVTRDQWPDISLLGAKECCEQELLSSAEAEVFLPARRKFYSGTEATWLNCALSAEVRGADRHIIKRRTQHNKLLMNLKELQGNPEGEAYKVLYLYHHPGAGGSTLARHVLWDLRKEYKVGLLDKISDNTKNQIQDMYDYKEREVPRSCLKPVILVLDKDDDVECDTFISTLNNHSDPQQLTCIIINCRRTHADPFGSPPLFSFRSGVDVFLSQKFRDAQERDEFLAVYAQLIDSTEDKQQVTSKSEVDLMLGFMVLVSENTGDHDYINRTIKNYVNLDGWQKQFLTYLSFLNTYNAAQPYIPTAFFDFMLPGRPKDWNRKSLTEWLTSSSTSGGFGCATWCIVEQFRSQTCVRIKLHSALAKKLLAHLSQKKLSELALEFLNCKGFESTKYPARIVNNIGIKMIRKREQDTSRSGSTTSNKYSYLINEVLNQEPYTSNAVHVAKKAFGVFMFEEQPDAFLSQLIARLLYLEHRNYEEALPYALQATELSPNQSYLLDTVGQIYADQLTKNFESFTGSSMARYALAIELSKNAVQWFQKAIGAARDINFYPHMGLIRVYHKLFAKMLPALLNEVFNGHHDQLVTYLSGSGCLPPQTQPAAAAWTELHHNFMRSLSQTCVADMQQCLDKLSMIKPSQHFQTQVSKDRERREEDTRAVLSCFRVYKNFWTCETNTRESTVLNIRAGERKVVLLGGLSFLTIMEPGVTVDDLKNMGLLLDKLTRSEPDCIKHAVKLLYVCLAFSTRLLPLDASPTHPEIYGLCNGKLRNLLLGHSSGQRIYRLVILMLLWPQKNNMLGIEYNHYHFQQICRDINENRGEKEFLNRGDDTVEQKWAAAENDDKPPKYKARTEFYLRQSGSCQKVIYRPYVKESGGKRPLTRQAHGEFWSSPERKKLLALCEGKILKEGQKLSAKNELSGQHDIVVHIADKTSALKYEVDQEVVFYLGFSWDGPVAYGLKRK